VSSAVTIQHRLSQFNMKTLVFLSLFCLVSFCAAEIFFSEEFNDGWDKRWVISKNKQADGTAGEFGVSAGKYFNDPEADKGLQTKQDARFYQISAETKDFSNRGKTLVLQFSAKHEQNIDCGGGYFKILPAGLDQENFNGDSPYNIMFGPDICGMTKRTHVILTYKGKNHLLKKDIPCKSDEFTHVYTLILKPDQTFKVLIDNKEERSGSLLADWEFLPSKEIKDPSVSKPSDWVDEKEIVDPEAKKPEGYDDIPKQITDPEAVMPEDWDSELDGEWEAPLIDNPAYKGEWKPAKIPNPAYKGEWVHPMIANPEYKEDNEIYAFDSNKYVGLEIWQVKAGTIFDNILVTDDEATAQEWAEKTLTQIKGEKEAYNKAEEERKAELAKNKEDAAKNGEVPEDDDSEDQDLDADLEEASPEDADHVHDEL